MFTESLFGFWADGLSCCARARFNTDSNGNRTSVKFDEYYTDPNDSTIQFFGFGSWHGGLGGTMNIALVDGSARSMSKSIDFRVFANLCTRNGGERNTEF